MGCLYTVKEEHFMEAARFMEDSVDEKERGNG